jgi:hypothetical protein
VIFVALLVSLVYTSVHLREVQKKTREATENLLQVDAKLTTDKKELDRVEASLRFYQGAFGTVASKVPNAAVVTIQVAYESQLDTAKEIANKLRHLGYEVPPDQAIEIRGAQHIAHLTYLRFFFPEDAKLAEHIVEQVNSMGVGVKVEPFDLSKEPKESLGEIHPRQFEFRLGSDYTPQEHRPTKN